MLEPNVTLSGEFTPFQYLLQDRFDDVRKFRQGEVIIHAAEDRSAYCYYVKSGVVVSRFIGRNGEVRTSSLRGYGTIFPLFYTYDSTSVERTFEFAALSDCELIRMEKDAFLDLMIEMPPIMIAMMDAWCKCATYSNTVIESSKDTVRRRTCTFLCCSADEHREVMATHEQIAQAVGASRETVSRVLSDLAKYGIIRQKRGRVIILDIERLRKISSDVVRVA